ncbi:hypothetical protein AG1IA_07819 [Rhizoctonia solani AG-1 IA]|uniref:Uncharacterized protein n=1 Tax=Thanatephorus cucumeris (strain AG1-IA) TaxID=983506 RepID=L8WP81_THACA|nr:hypothetical protein AG1IA_07819 [Rhizoctonia solani AG-1 IA]
MPMVKIQIRDDAYSPVLMAPKAASQVTSIWVPILLCAVLSELLHIGYMDKEVARPSPDVDTKWSESFDNRRPSTSGWTLNVPKWNTPVGPLRRGSDGGFPPGTLHITLPDPTLSGSVESLDHKAPPLTPVHVRHPTPPPAVHLATQPTERYHARAI